MDIRVPKTTAALVVGGIQTTLENPICLQYQNGTCVISNNSIIFKFDDSTNNPSSIFECQLDLELWFPCGRGGNPRVASPAHVLGVRANKTLPRGQEYFYGLSEGKHKFRVRTVNDHGTTGPQIEFSWIIDTMAPRTVFRQTPPKVCMLWKDD